MATLKCGECGSSNVAAGGNSVSCYDCGALTDYRAAYDLAHPEQVAARPGPGEVREVGSIDPDERFGHPVPPPDTDGGTPTGGDDGYVGGPRSNEALEVEEGVFADEVGASTTADPAPEPDDDGLDDLSKPELADLATEADIPGRSSMTKDELVEALRG